MIICVTSVVKKEVVALSSQRLILTTCQLRSWCASHNLHSEKAGVRE